MPALGLERLFGLSDRIRYYWPNAAIQKALKALAANIDGASGEVGLIAQFAGLPEGKGRFRGCRCRSRSSRRGSARWWRNTAAAC